MSSMDAQVVQYGTSMVIRIPPKLARKYGICIGDTLRVRMTRMKLVPVGESEEEAAAEATTPSKGRNPQSRAATSSLSMNLKRVGGPSRG